MLLLLIDAAAIAGSVMAGNIVRLGSPLHAQGQDMLVLLTPLFCLLAPVAVIPVLLPDGTNFRVAPYSMSDENIGINARMRASHRQNYVIPPRRNRSFPLVELLT